MAVALLGHMTMDLPVLKCGNCEPIKLSVHAGALGLAVLCGAYNAAAWLSRRERHLAVNTVLYTVLSIWEQQHVAHHLAELRRPRAEPAPAPPATVEKVEVVAPVEVVAAIAAAAVLAA
jgi:hypothetical protein